MKDNYNFKVNPPKLSSEEINKHKDFDALLEQFQQNAGANDGGRELQHPDASSFWLKYGIGGGLAVAASIALILIFRGVFSGGAANTNVLALNAPFDQAKLAFDSYEMDADKGDTLVHATGSKIIVPAAAFVDKDGQPVKGKVDIEYREFNDHVDMFVAGVPQKNSANQNLQTAAVMQIQGYKDGEPVFINEDKELKMELKSTVPANMSIKDLKVYAYTAKNKDWKYHSDNEVEVVAGNSEMEPSPTDTMEQNGISDNQEAARSTIIAKLEGKYAKPTAPIKPQRRIEENMTPINLDVDLEEFPEMAAYKDIVWAAKKSDVDALPNEGWKGLKMKRLDGDGLKYMVTLTPSPEALAAGQHAVSYVAYPLVRYTKAAMAKYKTEKAVYDQKIAERQQSIAAELQSWEKANGLFQEGENFEEDPSLEDAFKNIVNHFSIHQFGLWNVANPVNLNDMGIPQINAEFIDENGNAVAATEVFVVDQKRHLYYSSDSKESLRFDNIEGNELWVMTADQELWVMAPAPDSPAKKQFRMQPAAEINSVADVRKVLVL